MIRIFKRLLFGAPVHRTVDEVAGLKGRIVQSLIRIHTLEDGRVGVELVTKTMLSRQILPITLGPESARALAAALESAAAEASSLAA